MKQKDKANSIALVVCVFIALSLLWDVYSFLQDDITQKIKSIELEIRKIEDTQKDLLTGIATIQGNITVLNRIAHQSVNESGKDIDGFIYGPSNDLPFGGVNIYDILAFCEGVSNLGATYSLCSGVTFPGSIPILSTEKESKKQVWWGDAPNMPPVK